MLQLTIKTKLSQLVFVVVLLLLATGRSSSLALVELGDDGLDDVLHLLLLGLELVSIGLLQRRENQYNCRERRATNLPGYPRAT